MDWLGNNWIWLVIGIGGLTILALRGGGCGMSHGRYSDGREAAKDQAERQSRPEGAAATGSGNVPHHHGCC